MQAPGSRGFFYEWIMALRPASEGGMKIDEQNYRQSKAAELIVSK